MWVPTRRSNKTFPLQVAFSGSWKKKRHIDTGKPGWWRRSEHTHHNIELSTTDSFQNQLRRDLHIVLPQISPNYTRTMKVSKPTYLYSCLTRTSSVLLRRRWVLSPSWWPEMVVALLWFDWIPPQVMIVEHPFEMASASKNSSFRTWLKI